MRKMLGIAAILLGVAGLLLSVAAAGLGWYTALKTVDRVDRVAAQVDSGLASTDARLARVESRVSTVRTELHEIRGGAEAILAENPEFPRVRAEIERLLDRLAPALERVDATADSLRSVAAGFVAAADIVDQFTADPEATARIRLAAVAIDNAAATLDIPRNKINAVKSAAAVKITQRLVELAREAVAGSEMLAEALATARQQLAVARNRTTEYRDTLVFRVYAAAVAHTFLWLWFGLGQACLVGWGWRRRTRVPATV